MAKFAAELKLNYEILPVLLLLRRCLPRRKKKEKKKRKEEERRCSIVSQKTKPLPSKNHDPIKILMRRTKNENDEKK